MTQAELDKAIARITGESVRTISQLGFVELTRQPVECEPNRSPLVVDWDEADARRSSYWPL